MSDEVSRLPKKIEDIVFEDIIYDIPIELVDHDDSWNCRGKISGTECVSLSNDMRVNGQQTPGILRIYDEPKNGKPFGLVAGFRRFYATEILLCKKTYRATFKKNVSDDKAKAINFSENKERQQLNILQEAKVFEYFMRRGFTEKSMMDICNVNRGYIQPRVMLLKMGKEIQEWAAAGYLVAANLRDLYSYTNVEERRAAALEVVNKRKAGITKGVKIRKPKESKRPKGTIKTKRTPKQIQYLLEHLFNKKIPAGLHTRFASWCAGYITDDDLMGDIEEFAISPISCSKVVEAIQLCHDNFSQLTVIDMGEAIYDILKDFKGVQYERPYNGFPEDN